MSDGDWNGNLRLFALRGATTSSGNDEASILEATTELVSEVLSRNSLKPDRLVSCVFTSTIDLNAQFPAVAARQLGLSSVPLLCATEIAVPGSLPQTIRLMMHYYAEPDHVARHVYLRDAVALRHDLQSAQ